MLYSDLCYKCNYDSHFRKQIYEDIDSNITAWNLVKISCLQNIDKLSQSLDHDISHSKLEKNRIIPTEILNDERNSYKYTKTLAKKMDQQKSSKLSVSTAKTGSILLNRKKGVFDTAMSFIVEDEMKMKTASLPLHEEEEPCIVPSIFLSKSKNIKHQPTELKKATPSKIPGFREFIKAGCQIIDKLPYGTLFLDDTLKRRSEILFQDQQLIFWSLESN